MENKKLLTFFLLLTIIVMLGVVVWGSRNKKTDRSSKTVVRSETPIFFYGNTCSHCADVEEWMRKNKIEEKINVVKKEVYDNRANSLELTRKAESCGLPTNAIGVPFLYTPEGKCLIGTLDVINYLSDKAGLTDKAESTSSGKEGGL